MLSSEPAHTAIAPKHSHLLSLPAELRDIIWALVLGGITFEIQCKARIPWGTTVKNATTQQHSLALLRTCHQIHAETRLLPFTLNTFQFKSEDAFKPWLAKFDAAQRQAIAQVRIVTWKARHMVERRGFAPRRLGDVFLVEMFGGLKRVDVEVRYTGVVRECEKWESGGSELEDTDWMEQEGRLRLRCKKYNPRMEVRFERVAVSATMAPKRTSLRPTVKNRAAYVSAAWARVLKLRSEPATFRRFKNGLLDVGRMSFKSNSESPLLRLPPEIRNNIWEYVLGGKILDVVFLSSRKGRYLEEKTAISPLSLPESSHALLQVCRQLYKETALLPFSTNSFRFESNQAFDWIRHLLKVQQGLIKNVHIVTHRAERMFGWTDFKWSEQRVPKTIPVDSFPKVKRVIIEIRRCCFRDWEAGPKWTTKEYRNRVTANLNKITECIHAVNPDAQVVAMHTNISEGNSETGMTDSEDSGPEDSD
ncbi:hypothetical protein OPT61_g6313 [Boeremia exigua]|uniref:Uncharacterized protein n=1 Tax=Boeremia exigua TaxID=749465 RepID=A0ACC2I743_9PLEO|nr:hypothetical protein OPT61_g6313 [Boeremia exigua]